MSSAAAAPSPIVGWVLSHGLPWNASLASQLAAWGVSHVEQIKLLAPSEWGVLFANEPDTVRCQAVMVYDALLRTGPFDPQKCVAVCQDAAAVHPHSEDNAAACQEAVVAADLTALGQEGASAASPLDGAVVEDFLVPDRPASVPLENETFLSDEIFGLDDGNRERQDTAMVHPLPNAATCQEAAAVAALCQDGASAAPSLDGAPVAEFCGLIAEGGSVLERPPSVPLENETFRSEEIFGFDDSNREHNSDDSGKVGVAHAEANYMPDNLAGEQFSVREGAPAAPSLDGAPILELPSSAAPLEYETFRGEEIFGLDDSNRENIRNGNDNVKEGVAHAETSSMPANPAEEQFSLRENATKYGFSAAFLSSMTESQVHTLLDLYHSVQARTRESSGFDASQALAWRLERALGAGVSAKSEEEIEKRLMHGMQRNHMQAPQQQHSSMQQFELEFGREPAQVPQSQSQAQVPQSQPQLQHAPTPDPKTSLSFPVSSEVTIPLRQWVRNETLAGQLALAQHRQCLVRKTMVAYGLAELLHHLNQRGKNLEPGSLRGDCVLDNFAVRMANCRDATIEGVDILSHPGVGVKIIAPFFLNDEFMRVVGTNDANDGQTEELGQFLEVEIKSDAMINPSTDAAAGDGQVVIDETSMCHAFGELLYELYSETRPLAESNGDAACEIEEDSGNGPRRKKKTALDSLSIDDNATTPSCASQAGDASAGVASGGRPPRLKELGLPASISLLVNDLLESDWGEFTPDNAIPSLKVASEDLHLMLQDPDRFLFDRIPDRGGAAGLDIKQNKLYGREEERSLVTDIFCRASMMGETAALFIEGFSGSGKTKLVESVIDFVDSSGAYVIQQKFGQISQDQSMAAVISAFNDLCSLISRKRTPEELNAIVGDLTALFGTQLSSLARILPNVMLLNPELNALANDEGQSTEINLNRVGFILQLFMRVVSSREHPVLLFLDDLQWVDNASFDMLTEVLSDIKGSSCLYFIGSYRSNEVSTNHPIYKFMASLEACNVSLSRIRLDGMGIEDVNQMISDALGTVPRICRPLSRIVLQRTEGNPLFVLESLRSLADKNLLHYSFRERRWEWDIDKIAAEDVADNVCELLSAKMTSLPESSLMALKIASCFGSNVTLQTVETLASSSPNFSTLQKELERAVGEGFMNKYTSAHDNDREATSYRFVHDKVREAAYSLVGNKSKFHHDIGMLLYSAAQGQLLDSMIFVIVEQINYGDVQDPALRLKIAGLNHRAASKAMGNSNFAGAYFYLKAAVNLLPQDHWETNYGLSRSIFLLMGNAAYTEGHAEEAMSALDKILTHGRSLEDKLDAYYLKTSLVSNLSSSLSCLLPMRSVTPFSRCQLLSRQKIKLAHNTCVEVLTQLGEAIPAVVAAENFVTASDNIRLKLSKMKVEDWMSMKEMERPLHFSLMKFYSLAGFIAYFMRSPLINWYACKLVELSLQHGVCKHTALGLVIWAFSRRFMPTLEIEGDPVEKLAFKLMDRFDATDLLPWMYLTYYSGVRFEPLQACADMLKRGLEIGLSMGDTQVALMNGQQYVQKSLLGGKNLVSLKTECDYQVHLTEALSLPMSKMYLNAFQETIAILVAKKEQSLSDRLEKNGAAVAKELPADTLLFHRAVRSFWLGHYDRCFHQAEKCLQVENKGVPVIMAVFYRGISSFHSRKKWRSNTAAKKASREAIKVLKELADKSSWNYSNKSHLLIAHLESAKDKDEEARAAFVAAINSAKASKFIHEQGLACELAALHCLKCSDYTGAMNLFEQARDCYEKWGSQMKVDCMKVQIEETEKKLES